MIESWIAAVQVRRVAYDTGVPMGGDVTGTSPRFRVWAAQDPAGPTLDRVIIKGWIDGENEREQVWGVVCSSGRNPVAGKYPPTSASVNLETCARDDDAGAAELDTLFTDPDYNSGQHAFYDVRVLENPTCRWTTWMALNADIEPPDDVPATVQNRAWSSPIRVTPVAQVASPSQ